MAAPSDISQKILANAWVPVTCIYIYTIHIPRPSNGVKFQPPGLFLVVKGLKFQTLGGFWYISFPNYESWQPVEKVSFSFGCHGATVVEPSKKCTG